MTKRLGQLPTSATVHLSGRVGRRGRVARPVCHTIAAIGRGSKNQMVFMAWQSDSSRLGVACLLRARVCCFGVCIQPSGADTGTMPGRPAGEEKKPRYLFVGSSPRPVFLRRKARRFHSLGYSGYGGSAGSRSQLVAR